MPSIRFPTPLGDKFHSLIAMLACPLCPGNVLVPLCTALFFSAGCKKREEVPEPPDTGIRINLTSPAFREGEPIPKKYGGE